MSFDGIAMACMAYELKEILADGRVDKVYQPETNEIHIIIRNGGKNHRLLVSAHPQWARVQITSFSKPNPDHPPMFCMLLRKHLENSRLIDVQQESLERIVSLTFEGLDETGELVQRKLICEIMGKHSNIVLIEPKNNKILDGIFRYSYAVSQHRQILPGQVYVLPPTQEKTNILDNLTEEIFTNILLTNEFSMKLSKAMLTTFLGFGPQTCQELINRADLDPNTRLEFLGEYDFSKLWREVSNLAKDIKNGSFQPQVLYLEDRINAFSPIAFSSQNNLVKKDYSTLSEAMDQYYQTKIKGNILDQKTIDLEKVLKKELERCYKKAGLQENTLLESRDAEAFRVWGDLIMANLYSLEQGEEAILVNFYDEEQKEIKIPLDPSLTPRENAKNLYKKYQKAKQSGQKAEVHLYETRDEILYLESVVANLQGIENDNDFEEIRGELVETGYLKPRPQKKGKKHQEISGEPIRINYEGFEIWVGKNNKQNDFITLKVAKPNDTWFHVKDIPGSHVLIRNPLEQRIPNHVLELGAMLAAFFSKARNSATVPVDMAERRHVRKPKGAKPGMVIYDNQTTIYITPREERIKEVMSSKGF